MSLICLSNFNSFALYFVLRLLIWHIHKFKAIKIRCFSNFSHLEFLHSRRVSSRRCKLFLITRALATWTFPEKISFKEISNTVSKESNSFFLFLFLYIWHVKYDLELSLISSVIELPVVLLLNIVWSLLLVMQNVCFCIFGMWNMILKYHWFFYQLFVVWWQRPFICKNSCQ